MEGESAQRAFSLLTLLANGDDRAALRWWLGMDSQTSQAKSYRILRDYCQSSGDSPRDVLEAVCQGTLDLKGIKPLVKKYQELKSELSRFDSLPLSDLVDQLFPEGDPSFDILREAALMGLPEAEDLGTLFNHVRSHITQPEVPAGEFARIMSLHKSKGLTCRSTIITGCSQGLIPFESPESEELSMDERILQEREQRRLFYVAVTRCTESLVISSFAAVSPGIAKQINARIHGSTKRVGQTMASQFIGELGPSAPTTRRGQEWTAAGYA